MDNYWIKKGDTGTVQSHLDNEMDDYWKSANKAKQSGAQAATTLQLDNTKVSNSIDSSMLVNMQDIHSKDITGASPHYQSGLHIISN